MTTTDLVSTEETLWLWWSHGERLEVSSLDPIAHIQLVPAETEAFGYYKTAELVLIVDGHRVTATTSEYDRTKIYWIDGVVVTPVDIPEDVRANAIGFFGMPGWVQEHATERIVVKTRAGHYTWFEPEYQEIVTSP